MTTPTPTTTPAATAAAGRPTLPAPAGTVLHQQTDPAGGHASAITDTTGTYRYALTRHRQRRRAVTVFVTSGGRRFHADRACYALANGRATQAYRAGSGLYGESWYGAGNLDGLYPVAAIPIEALPARDGYTACRVCVPPALALPATGETYGHEPFEYDGVPICRRCFTRHHRRFVQWDGTTTVREDRRIVPWPCASAVVLGLVVTDADRWNAAYPVGTPVRAWPWTRTDEPTLTRTRTPAWRLGHGDSVVSVDGHAGGIHLTHVEAL